MPRVVPGLVTHVQEHQVRVLQVLGEPRDRHDQGVSLGGRRVEAGGDDGERESERER